MACSTQIRWEDCCLRCSSQQATSSGGAWLVAFLGGALTWSGKSRALVAGVDLGGDLGIVPQQIGDTFGAYGGGVMHPARAYRTKPQQPAGTVADRGRFDRVL